jgi:hypothetical protein
LCWSGFQGVSCNYDDDEFASMVESRHMLVEGLSRLFTSRRECFECVVVVGWIVIDEQRLSFTRS